MNKFSIFFFLTFLFIGPAHAVEAVPRTVFIQGNLATADGVQVTGIKSMRFSIYADNIRIWYAQYEAVNMNAGAFAVYLGDTAQGGSSLNPQTNMLLDPSKLPISASLFAAYDTNTTMEVGVEVFNGTSFEGFPTRYKIGSAMFALKAETANSVNSSSRVQKSAYPYTGNQLAAQLTAGNNVCDLNSHVCSAMETVIIETLSPVSVFEGMGGWVIGSFPNTDVALRSLVLGSENTACPSGQYLVKYGSSYTHGNIKMPGGLMCAPGANTYYALCCRNPGT